MIRFIRMWLLLRILVIQEEAVIKHTRGAVERYKHGEYPHVETSHFVLHATTMNLWVALLPKFFRRSLLPQHKSDPDLEPNSSRIKDIDSLLCNAVKKGYVEDLTSKDKEVRLPKILRTSTDGDFFITIIGGFDSLLKEYPRAWALVAALILSPSWLPWLIKKTCHVYPYACAFLTN